MMWSINRGLQKTSYISKNKVKIEKRCKQNSLVFGKLNRCCRIQWIMLTDYRQRSGRLYWQWKYIRNWIRWHVPRMWYADTWSAKRLSEEKMSTKILRFNLLSVIFDLDLLLWSKYTNGTFRDCTHREVGFSWQWLSNAHMHINLPKQTLLLQC